MSDIQDSDDSLDGLNSHDCDSLAVDNSAILDQTPTNTSHNENADSLLEDPESVEEVIKARLKEMEAEAEKYKKIDNSAILEQSPTVTSHNENVDSLVEDPELEAIRARVKEMEAEAKRLKEMQNEVEKVLNLSPAPPHLATGAVAFPWLEETVEADTRSVYVENVDYSGTVEEL